MTIYRRVIERNFCTRTDRYAIIHSCLHTTEPDYSGAWLDPSRNRVKWGCIFLASNPASHCVLEIIEDVSGDVQGSVLNLLSLLHATHALNQVLWNVLYGIKRKQKIDATLQNAFGKSVALYLFFLEDQAHPPEGLELQNGPPRQTGNDKKNMHEQENTIQY
ncbi:hypothetical protein TNCV_1204021 [Trichonephila clavipes]|nr:hypothetical protein TNCV_1204021 [Trichonephila clavipes]